MQISTTKVTELCGKASLYVLWETTWVTKYNSENSTSYSGHIIPVLVFHDLFCGAIAVCTGNFCKDDFAMVKHSMCLKLCVVQLFLTASPSCLKPLLHCSCSNVVYISFGSSVHFSSCDTMLSEKLNNSGENFARFYKSWILGTYICNRKIVMKLHKFIQCCRNVRMSACFCILCKALL